MDLGRRYRRRNSRYHVGEEGKEIGEGKVERRGEQFRNSFGIERSRLIKKEWFGKGRD